MKKLICILILTPYLLLSQNQQKFRLFNGVEFDGVLQKITEDSIEIITNQGNKVVFALNQITQVSGYVKSNAVSDPILERNFLYQAGLNLGLDNPDEGFLGSVGLEATFLYKFRKDKNQFITFKTGYEIVQAFLPTRIIPFTAGYQLALINKNNHQVHWQGKAGWGITAIDTENNFSETRTTRGGFRLESGFTWFPRMKHHSSFYLGTSIFFQNVSYRILNDWSNIFTKQQIRRFSINVGVLF